jgi:Zn-dependent M28 family amino/carboxypeptidase
MTNLEAFRVLLTDPQISANQATNTIEFHWYAGEEGGLLGSQDIFQQYAKDSRDVAAMFNQDMTGYVKPNTTPVIGLVTDFVDVPLTEYIKKVVTAVSRPSLCGLFTYVRQCREVSFVSDMGIKPVLLHSIRDFDVRLCLFRPCFGFESRVPIGICHRGTPCRY